ncbi:MAG: hypothetical protein RR191_02205 [Cetobacterium sp.]|uniref:hypothetical protein n=1 Tax=Cetobacterium sp. TaxID=2071632 RepID=UPI002FCC3286
MKKFLLLMSIFIILTGCSDIVLRKDLSTRIEFDSGLKHGNYELNFYKFKYPDTHEEKNHFFSQLESFYNEAKKRDTKINLILDKELEEDVKSILNSSGLGLEKLAFKRSSDLSVEEMDKLSEIVSIDTPLSGGIIQRDLNRQYYLLLKLQNKESNYNPDFYYTELDKEKIIGEMLEKRKNLKLTLEKNKENFVYEESDGVSPVYISNFKNVDSLKDLKSKVIVVSNSKFNGTAFLDEKIVLFLGTSGSTVEMIRKFKFNNKLLEFNNPKSAIESLKNNNGIDVSKIEKWHEPIFKNESAEIAERVTTWGLD